jgi:hypothetical protein
MVPLSLAAHVTGSTRPCRITLVNVGRCQVARWNLLPVVIVQKAAFIPKILFVSNRLLPEFLTWTVTSATTRTVSNPLPCNKTHQALRHRYAPPSPDSTGFVAGIPAASITRRQRREVILRTSAPHQSRPGLCQSLMVKHQRPRPKVETVAPCGGRRDTRDALTESFQ